MQFAQRCGNFSPEVWSIIAQSPKTILKKSKKNNLSQIAPMNK